ncbi:MAG TPA: prephenate dehydrogenase/arogenate dehydrogenase family protein [Thermoanaerobaculia bacterium]
MRALIVGLGLIGGAVAMALRRRGWRVRFVDKDPSLRLEGVERVDTVEGDADVIVLATPVDVAVELLPSIETRGVVTSVGSVMRPLRAAGKSNFVAGHPMAGWHEGGLANARHVELEGASWFVDAEDERVEELIRACGARSIQVTAEEHDAAVALTSHLPQVLSTALFAYLSDRPEVQKFAGGGLKSFRLAASDGEMWHSVLAENRDHLRPHADKVAELVRAIIDGDDREAFQRARALWRALTE